MSFKLEIYGNKENHALMSLALIGNSTEKAYERCHQDPMNKHELKYTYENHPDFEAIQSINSAFLCLNFGLILTICHNLINLKKIETP